jgi:hypothetical protein
MRRGSLAFIAALLVAPATTYADTVTCADGTMSESGRGACSHHGGVAKTRAAQPRSQDRDRSTADRPRAGRDGDLIVRCGDGTISIAQGRGACSHHGGVAARPRVEPTDRQARKTEPARRRSLPDLVIRCADGTTSLAAGRGACSHHGGAVGKVEPDRTNRVDTEAETRVPTPGLVVKCDDGTVSPAGRGACSHHGGIARESTRASEPREQTVNPEAPTPRCKDGTVSYSLHHSGTCSSHGGVREWLDQ